MLNTADFMYDLNRLRRESKDWGPHTHPNENIYGNNYLNINSISFEDSNSNIITNQWKEIFLFFCFDHEEKYSAVFYIFSVQFWGTPVSQRTLVNNYVLRKQSIQFSLTFTSMLVICQTLSRFYRLFNSVQSLSRVRIFATPWTSALPCFPVHHELPELTQTHVHQVGDAIHPANPLSTPSPPAFNLSQYQGLFQWVSSLHQVAKVLELQLQL